MAASLVEQVEDLFLSRFERFADELRNKYPRYVFFVYRGSVGSLTEYQGYHVGIECAFPDKKPDETDSVALTFDLCHLTGEPKAMMGVCWGYPEAYGEAYFDDAWLGNDDWPIVTPSRLLQLENDLPRLIEVFVSCIERGYPSNREQT